MVLAKNLIHWFLVVPCLRTYALQPSGSTKAARIVGSFASDEVRKYQSALEQAGFVVSNEAVAAYRWNPAVGMLQLAEGSGPRWIPLVQDQEQVLVQNGWSFLDLDDSEPVSMVGPSRLEEAYVPQWTKDVAAEKDTWSSLGFSLNPPVDWDSNPLPELSRQVLLEGDTDPPGLQTTADGVVLKGVDVQPAILCNAFTGFPLFCTKDLRPSSGGWLNFRSPVATDHVIHLPPTATDSRIEVICAQTKCHLGHYFGEEGGYCINASALKTRVARPYSYRSLDEASSSPSIDLLRTVTNQQTSTLEVVLGAGCFWHVEAALRRLPGVRDTQVGFAGGALARPIYEQVCQLETGHAEVVRVIFDPMVLAPKTLLDCYLMLHNPTKVRAHGKHAANTGQYRSCIFLPTSQLESTALDTLAECSQKLGKEVCTEVRVMTPAVDQWFWPAEERHQRHDEKKAGAAAQTHTLKLSEWIDYFGRVTGSSDSETVEEGVAVSRLSI